MIQINPLKSYIDGGVRAALTTPPSASLVFDLPGKAIWVKGVKLKGTDHTYTFSHDNYITLTNTPDSNESEDIKIGVNTSALKNTIDTTYGVVSTTANGLAPKFASGNKLAASTATTYYFLGWAGTTLKWYQAPFRNIRINSETTDCLGVNNTDPLIIGSGNGISVTWDSTNKKIIITNTKPDVNHNTDRTGIKLATVSGTKKTDSTLILANSTTGLNIQGGTNKFLIGDGTNYIEVPVVPSVSNKDATIGTTLTTIATVAGVDIKAKIASYSLSNHTHSVKINGSTKTITASGTVDLGNYLPLSGGTMGGTAWIKWPDSGNISNNNEGVTFPVIRGGLEWRGQTDYIKLFSEETGRDNLDLVLQFGDDNSNGFSIRNASNVQTSHISAGGVITTKTFKGNLDWSYITNKPSSYTPSAHTHAWNSLTHSSTTLNQAILTNGSANGWKLYTLNISGWNNAANNAHSHSNKSVLDSITSGLVNNWNTAYNFVNTISSTDTDKVINKWDEIVNFLAGISEDDKLNTLLNSKLSVYKLADNTDVEAIKNNGIYYSTFDDSSSTLVNSPFSNSFTLINITSHDNGDDLRRSRLAFNAYGEIKISNDRGLANTAETWYNILTSKNTYISENKGYINGSQITYVNNSGNATNATNARKLVNWYSTRPTSLNTQFGDGSLRIFHATASTTEGKSPADAIILHLAWDNNGGWDTQLGINSPSGRVYSRAQNKGTWQSWKTLAFTTDIPTSLKNPYALTISLNGTSLGAYDGSAAKSINITPGSIGAATSKHNHDSSYVKYAKVTKSTADSANAKPYIYNIENEAVISGYYNYWYILNLGQYSGGNFGTLIAMPYQESLTDSELFIRSAKGGTWRDWRRVLHSNNYASILDSRYYTESEINTKLGAYLPLTGGTLTGDLYINTKLYGPAVGNNPRNIYGSGFYFYNCNSSTTSTYNFGLYQWNNEFQFTYRTSVDNRHKGTSFTIQGSNGQVTFAKTPKVGSTLISLAGHTHSYLPLSGGIMTGNITYNALGTSYIGNGTNDAANGVGGALNNLVISSWNGISFTTSCGGLTYTNKNAVSINCRNGHIYANTFVGTFSGNASTATKLTSSAGNTALPIYFSDGKPVACVASSVFSNLSNNGNNLSITIAGQNRTLMVAYANNADTVDGLHYNRFVYNITSSYNRNGPYYKKIASVNTANWTWAYASLVLDIFSTGYSNGICYLGTVEVICGHWNNTDHNPSVTCRWILKVPNSKNQQVVAVKNLNTNTIDVYLLNDLWDCQIIFNVVYNNNFSILSKSLTDEGFVNLPTASDTIVHYIPSNPTYIGNATTATIASKLGTLTVGATNVPIYLNGGTPTVVNLNSTANNLINNLSVEDSVPTDNDYYIAQYVGGGTTTTTYHRRPHSALYTYIKNKAEGTWNISINGNAKGLSNNGVLDSQEKIDNFLTANILKYATFKTTESNNIGFASNDGMILSIPWSSTSYGAQIAFDDTTFGTVKVRGKKDNSWGNWYTLLHSGNSNVSGGGSTWGSSITVNINGTSKTLTIPGNPNTDYRVTQSETTTANYRPLVVGYTSVSTAGSGMAGSVTNQVYLSNKFYVQPSTGNLYATNFVGTLSGNASSATKLQTARTIWGQSFDGTGNIDGCLNITSDPIGSYTQGIRINQISSSSMSSIWLATTSSRGYNNGMWGISATNTGNFRIRGGATSAVDLLNISQTGNVGIGTTSPGYKLHVVGDIYTTTGFKKNGSSDSYILLGGGGHKSISDFMLKTDELSNNLTIISKSLTVTQAWMDTGIKYTDLPANGTYIVQVSANNSSDYMWSNYWSGIMSWYTGDTNDGEADEIILHRAGHAYHHTIYLRTIMTTSSDGRHLRLQIAADTNLSTAVTYTFKFKRVI